MEYSIQDRAVEVLRTTDPSEAIAKVAALLEQHGYPRAQDWLTNVEWVVLGGAPLHHPWIYGYVSIQTV